MPSNATPIEIPRPENVRQRLAECLQEARLLRSLLRVATKAEQSQRYSSESAQQQGAKP